MTMPANDNISSGVERFDFIVIGASIAGRALATRLARAGSSVLALEPAEDGEPALERLPGVGGTTDGMLLCPSNRIWDDLQTLTGDAEWSAANARRRYQNIEYIENRPFARALHRCCFFNPARRGFDGWLPTRALGSGLGRADDRYFGPADPNDWSHVDALREAMWCRPPSHDVDVAEIVRLRLLDTVHARGAALTLRRGVRVTRLLGDGPSVDGKGVHIGGVQYVDSSSDDGRGMLRRAIAEREVILCGGTLEVPRLLLFSGIGPAALLARHGIPLLLDRAGVGAGFSACAEIAVETEAPGEFGHFQQGGVDGTLLLTLHSGMSDSHIPDVLMYRRALGGRTPEEMTWRWTIRVLPALLGGQAWRRAPEGVGTLRALPHCPVTEAETEALMNAVKFLRRILEDAGVADTAARVVAPVEVIDLDEDDIALASFIRRHTRRTAPVGTCPMGGEGDPFVALDSRMRVIGTTNLRVVDAASFPTPPGFFLDVPLLIAAETIADDLLRHNSGLFTSLKSRLAPNNSLAHMAMRPAGTGAAAAAITALAVAGRRIFEAR